MDLLILGGTVFLGPALVEAATTKGHRVTLFNRGVSNPGPFPAIEQIHGNRRDLSALAGRQWDAVVDTCGWLPDVVEVSVSALRNRAKTYVFISSGSVYDTRRSGLDEASPVSPVSYRPGDKITGPMTGGLKYLCEIVVRASFQTHALIVRPGALVGRGDQRLAYWARRVLQGGVVLAPGLPTQFVQFIDVRDLAAWIVRMLERDGAGTYNAVSPPFALTLGELLSSCAQVQRTSAEMAWIPSRFLLSHGVKLTDLPFWIPEERRDLQGLFTINAQKAIATGLTFRPLRETILASIEPPPGNAKLPASVGLSRVREQELLQLWSSGQTNVQPRQG